MENNLKPSGTDVVFVDTSIGENQDMPRSDGSSMATLGMAAAEFMVPQEIYERRREEYMLLPFPSLKHAERMLAELIRRDEEHSVLEVIEGTKSVTDRFRITIGQIADLLQRQHSRLKIAVVDNAGPEGQRGYYAPLRDEDPDSEMKPITIQQALYDALMKLPSNPGKEEDREEDNDEAEIDALPEREWILLSDKDADRYKETIGYNSVKLICGILAIEDIAKDIRESTPYVMFAAMKGNALDAMSRYTDKATLSALLEREDGESPREDSLFWKTFSSTVDALWDLEKGPAGINTKLLEAYEIIKRLKTKKWEKIQVKNVVARHFGTEDLLAEELEQKAA